MFFFINSFIFLFKIDVVFESVFKFFLYEVIVFCKICIFCFCFNILWENMLMFFCILLDILWRFLEVMFWDNCVFCIIWIWRFCLLLKFFIFIRFDLRLIIFFLRVLIISVCCFFLVFKVFILLRIVFNVWSKVSLRVDFFLRWCWIICIVELDWDVIVLVYSVFKYRNKYFNIMKYCFILVILNL